MGVQEFREVFPNKKSVIWMIHLAGNGAHEKLNRALEEIAIYDGEGVDGFIVENYHVDISDVQSVLDAISRKRDASLIVGVNTLGSRLDYQWISKYGIGFIQFDNGLSPNISEPDYVKLRKEHPRVPILGGVRFKYQAKSGLSLAQEVAVARNKCDAIVTTGDGTGIETPLDKLRLFRELIGDFPLVVGAGVTADNVYDQLQIGDAAIVGSYFKNGNTEAEIDRRRVRDLMRIVEEFN